MYRKLGGFIMQDKISLLKQLIEKETELFGDDSFIEEEIKNIIDYRHIRTEQAWYSMATDGITDRTVAAELSRIDRERRVKHNAALRSVNIINRFCEKVGMEKLYEEKTLTNDQINNHDNNFLDLRRDITDFMLQLVAEIQNTKIKTKEPKNNFLKRSSGANK